MYVTDVRNIRPCMKCARLIFVHPTKGAYERERFRARRAWSKCYIGKRALTTCQLSLDGLSTCLPFRPALSASPSSMKTSPNLRGLSICTCGACRKWELSTCTTFLRRASACDGMATQSSTLHTLGCTQHLSTSSMQIGLT